MNTEWSILNKKMNIQIREKDTFYDGICTLLELRKELMKEIMAFKGLLNREDFNSIPFINGKGYHNKTIAYSLYHTFRIEDIVSNSLIKKREQIFLKDNYVERMKSPIITTGNELIKQQISIFSSKLNLDELYQYISDVDVSTTQLLKEFSYENLKTKMTEEDKELLKLLDVVSNDDNAVWLIDYWCDKNIKSLIQMPFSRHWIMHIEASIRIKNKIYKN